MHPLISERRDGHGSIGALVFDSGGVPAECESVEVSGSLKRWGAWLRDRSEAEEVVVTYVCSAAVFHRMQIYEYDG